MARSLGKVHSKTGTVVAGTQVSANPIVLKDISVLVRGYALALRRLEKAERAAPRRPDDIYIALSEAAHWLIILAPRLPTDGDLKGVRFARNRADHQWASVTYFDAPGAHSVWRVATQLPQPSDPRHFTPQLERCYQNHLEGRPILEVFRRLEAKVKAL